MKRIKEERRKAVLSRPNKSLSAGPLPSVEFRRVWKMLRRKGPYMIDRRHYGYKAPAPKTARVSLWQRIKNFFRRLFHDKGRSRT